MIGRRGRRAPPKPALMQEVEAVVGIGDGERFLPLPWRPVTGQSSGVNDASPRGRAAPCCVRMRRIVLGVATALALAVPAAAATIDPATLVLSQADVPAGFRLDREGSGVRSNAAEAKNDRELGAQLRRWGRVTGYEAEFDRADATLSCRADLFTSPRGAREMFELFEREVAKAGIRGLERTRIGLGAGGWVYGGGSAAAFVVVAWRDRRVFAGVAATGLSRRQTLALARVQQRRIAAALP